MGFGEMESRLIELENIKLHVADVLLYSWGPSMPIEVHAVAVDVSYISRIASCLIAFGLVVQLLNWLIISLG